MWLASTYASGISNSQNTNRLIQVGVRQVSPAPLNDWDMTIPKAYSGKPSAMIRRAWVATRATSGSAVNAATIHGASVTNTTPNAPRKARL